MNTLSLLHGIRFVDSFFPSGGYAFSSGLEAAVQGGAVRNAEDLDRYATDLLRNGIGQREAVAVALAHEAAAIGHLPSVLKADQQLDTMHLCRETRMASRQMGRQVIRISAEQIQGSPTLRDFHVAVETSRTPGHLAVSLGLTLGACGWSREDAIAAYLYQTASGFVSAALKLMPIGQREGQYLLEEWTPLIAQLSRNAQHVNVMTSWSPVQDIYAMKHSRLESRLFRS